MSETDGDALWTWSLALYADPAVKTAILDAQNRFGVHAPLILWAAHAAKNGGAVTPEDARDARAQLSALSAHTQALRGARRQLPALAAGLPAGPRDAAIAHIAEAEIALEQLELAKLATQRKRQGEPALETLRANLAAALAASGLNLAKPDSKDALDALAKAFGVHFTG